MVLNVKGLTRSLLFAGLLTLWPALLTHPAMADSGAGSGGLPDERLGHRTAPLLLLSHLDVREDLGLSEAQTMEAEKAINDFYARAWALKGKKGPAADAARKQIDQDQVAWINAHLTGGQRGRLVQVELWWEGPSAIVTRPLVGETVGLTANQRATLVAAVEARNAARAGKSLSMADEDALWQKTKASLSPSQVERWRTMLGPKFHPRIALSLEPVKVTR